MTFLRFQSALFFSGQVRPHNGVLEMNSHGFMGVSWLDRSVYLGCWYCINTLASAFQSFLYLTRNTAIHSVRLDDRAYAPYYTGEITKRGSRTRICYESIRFWENKVQVWPSDILYRSSLVVSGYWPLFAVHQIAKNGHNKPHTFPASRNVQKVRRFRNMEWHIIFNNPMFEEILQVFSSYHRPAYMQRSPIQEHQKPS